MFVVLNNEEIKMYYVLDFVTTSTIMYAINVNMLYINVHVSYLIISLQNHCSI